MPSKLFPPDVLEQAQSVLDAWSKINDELVFTDLNFNSFASVLKDATLAGNTVVSIENSLTEARDQRDALYTAAWSQIKRVRAGIKANYGDDSIQYELIGGTPLSERKSARRSAQPAELA